MLKTVGIDEETWKTAKRAALEEGVSLAQWLSRAVAFMAKGTARTGSVAPSTTRQQPASPPIPKPKDRVATTTSGKHLAGSLEPKCRRCKHLQTLHYGTAKSPQPRCNHAGCPCPRFQ